MTKQEVSIICIECRTQFNIFIIRDEAQEIKPDAMLDDYGWRYPMPFCPKCGKPASRRHPDPPSTSEAMQALEGMRSVAKSVTGGFSRIQVDRWIDIIAAALQAKPAEAVRAEEVPVVLPDSFVKLRGVYADEIRRLYLTDPEFRAMWDELEKEVKE